MEVNDITDRVPRSLKISKDINFDLPEKYNASEILFDNLEKRPDKIAIYSDNGNATYRELCETSNKVGNALTGMGLKPFSRILMVLDDTAIYPSAIFGAMRAGVVPVLINTLSPPEMVNYYLKDSRSTVVVISEPFSHLITEETVSGTHLKTLIVDGTIKVDIPEISSIIWNDWISGHSSSLVAANTSKDDMAFWMYSSGSTGRPKGIVHLHHDMAYTNESYAKDVLCLTEDDICYSPPKIFFAYGFGNSITFPFSVGASVVLSTERPQPEIVYNHVEKYKPTVFFGLPTLYSSLLSNRVKNETAFNSVRLCISAAETLSRDLFSAWNSRFDLDIIEGLGSTEVLHIYISNKSEDFKVGSAGKPVKGYEVELRNDEGTIVEGDEPGVLWVRGDSNAPCYWNKLDKTLETMKEGWIYTGDRFEVDDEGFYYFRGRADDLIKISGQWVYPLEIELCLKNHPSIKECAVLGLTLADERMTTKAFVVLSDGYEGNQIMTTELKDYAQKNLLPHKYAREISYMKSLPKTGSGKIDRQKLKEDI